MSTISYHIDGKPFAVKLVGKTIVSPKCSACLDNEHDYCPNKNGQNNSCGCNCSHKSS